MISAHQNNLKTLKTYEFEVNKKNSIFFKNIFKTQKQTGLRKDNLTIMIITLPSKNNKLV